MAHWPSSAGACAPFCACCPVRQAAGLPLNSNVRRHSPVMQYASFSIQILRPVCASLFGAPCILQALAHQGASQCKISSCRHCSAHVLRRSRVAGAVCTQSSSSRGLAKQSIGVAPIRPAFGASRSPFFGWLSAWRNSICTLVSRCRSPSHLVQAAGLAGAVLHVHSLWRSRAAAERSEAQFLFGSSQRFSYSRAMPPENSVPPNPSLKGRSNGMPPGLGHRVRWPILCGPGLASYRRPPP
jgi:hypothetical protein